MIAEAIVRKDGILIKGFKTASKSGKIFVHVEQFEAQKVASCRGILKEFANKQLIPSEKGAWQRRTMDE